MDTDLRKFSKKRTVKEICPLDTHGTVMVQYPYHAWDDHLVLDANGTSISTPARIGHSIFSR